MSVAVRQMLDKVFTALTAATVILLSLVLLAILGPMIYRGSGAVVFKGTVEWRKMQLALFKRGDADALKVELDKIQEHRDFVYQRIQEFKQGVNPEALSDRARKIHREFGQQLRERDVSGNRYSELRSLSRDLRNSLESAFESDSSEQVAAHLEEVLQYQNDERLAGTVAAEFFPMAASYQKAVQKIDFGAREKYAESLAEIEGVIGELFGPRRDEAPPALVRLRFGATRWDRGMELLDKLLYAERWVEVEPGEPLIKKRYPREELFAGTDLEPVFGYVSENLPKMLRPRLTFYWQYFIDDNYNSHYFGGVGPEILGTLLITVVAMVVVMPLGLISAAYLVECSSDNYAIRIIRMCINTLAGVPSIVFGLFGLAFFVLYLFPIFGLPSKACILAASLTLAVLTLPVMIRASEEAIRAVPPAYKEASLALGASHFRTFMTVILPAALPGILTGVILSLSRVAGETAPILFTGAVSMGPVPDSLLDPTRTLSYGSYNIAVGDRLSMMVPHKQYGMVVTLILLILCLNGLAIVLRSRVFKKLKGQ